VAVSSRKSSATWRRALGVVLVYGGTAGLLVAVLQLTEYRFLVVQRSMEVWVALVAALAAAVGIWLGRSLRREPRVVVREVPVEGPFVRDEERVRKLGLTPRELEILELLAAGLSNREIGERLFVSENTVKTHCRRLFDKLGAGRRTQAVRIGREGRLIP